MPLTKPKTLAPVRPSPLIAAAYKRRLDALIDQMERSILHWVPAAYRQNEPAIATLLAQDEAPANTLQRVVRRLTRYWQRRFNEAAQDLAAYFATEVAERSDVALRHALRKGGFSIRFQPGRAAQDVLRATINENVALIRSIPQQHFSAVEGYVMRSVSAGRDLEVLTKDLRQHFGVTRRRAELIARDQNNKATATIQRVRQAELGLTEAIWVHSGGGKVPRPSHVRAGKERVRYSLIDGWYDPDEKKNIFPGELINCRCVARPVVPGFS